MRAEKREESEIIDVGHISEIIFQEVHLHWVRHLEYLYEFLIELSKGLPSKTTQISMKKGREMRSP